MGKVKLTDGPGTILSPLAVVQWLLVGILHQEIIAHISELRTRSLLFDLGFDDKHLFYKKGQMFHKIVNNVACSCVFNAHLYKIIYNIHICDII